MTADADPIKTAEYPSGQLDEQVLDWTRAHYHPESHDEASILFTGRGISMRNRLLETLTGQLDGLPGLDLQSLKSFAQLTLQENGFAVLPSPDSSRKMAIEAVIRSQDELSGMLSYYELQQLREGPGYAGAFSSTIGECIRSGITPDVLEQSDGQEEDRYADLAILWKRANELMNLPDQPITTVRGVQTVHPGYVLPVFVDRIDELAVPERSILALSYNPSAVEQDVLSGATGWIDDLHRIVTPLDDGVKPSSDADTWGLDGLKTGLFSYGEYRLSEDGAADSKEVQLKKFPSSESEIEHTVYWMLEKLNEDIPPQDIAILCADSDRTSSVLSWIDRLVSKTEDEGEGTINRVPVDPAGGVTLSETPGGASLVQLVRALQNFLPQDEMVHLLPMLDIEAKEDDEDNDSPGLSRSEWREVVLENGMLGGDRSRREQATKWPEYIDQFLEVIAEKLEMCREEGRTHEKEDQLLRKKRVLEACREPVSQLAKIAGRIAENPEDYTLDALWSDVCSFARDHLDTERFGRNLLETVEDRMDLDNGSAVSSNISAEVGIRLLSSMMSGLEVPPSDKFREGIDVGDGVFVGGVSSRPLDQFDAIRIIGLTENRLPSPPKEDPILSDAQRERLLDRGYALPRSTEAPENRMKDLYSMINSCGREVVFSTASRDADGQKRAPSSLFVDVCISSGLSGGEPPGASVLERLMDRDEAHREQFPLTNRFRCTRVNRNHVRVPASWKDGPRPALSLERITSLLSEYDERNPYADLFGDLSSADLPDDLLHGMTEDKPISPSRIKTLAQCPHQYLLENVLYYDERSEPQETTELDPLTFGSLVHDTAEEIYEHVFEGADPDPEEHEEEIEAIIRSQWDDMMRTYELVGEISEQRQWERFQSTIRTLIRRDREQERLGRELIMEESIGFDEAIQHSSGLFVRGTLDRVEVDELDNAYIWDIKSGSKKDKNKYILYLDPQVGIYQLLLRNSERFGDQAVYRVGFLYPSSGSGYERTFDRQDDGDSFSLDELEANTDRLMNLIKSLFDEQVFPRTFDKNHCNYCQFQELCGDESREHAREFIENRNPDWMDAYQEFHD